jgi:hypothetical protein
MFDKTLCKAAAIGFLPKMMVPIGGRLNRETWPMRKLSLSSFAKLTEHPWRSEKSDVNVAQTLNRESQDDERRTKDIPFATINRPNIFR